MLCWRKTAPLQPVGKRGGEFWFQGIVKTDFFDLGWWKDVSSASVGALIGIILTFGISSYLDKLDKEDMAWKTVKLTLHNQEVAISNMSQTLDELKMQEQIFHSVYALMPDRIKELSEDSLNMFLQIFSNIRVSEVDRTVENIFSSSFEVWRFLDDEKVIGRISNCYTIIRRCDELRDEMNATCQNIFADYWNERTLYDYSGIVPAVQALAMRNDVRLYYEQLHVKVEMCKFMVDLAKKLNDTNKRILNISQEELDEIGNLIEGNQHGVDFSTCE